MYPNLPIVKVFVDYYFLQNCNWASSWVSSSLDCSNKKKKVKQFITLIIQKIFL